MFVYQDKKEFVYVVDLEVLICMCQLIELCDNTRNSNFIKKIISFLIFLFAKHGFEMWWCGPSTTRYWFGLRLD